MHEVGPRGRYRNAGYLLAPSVLLVLGLQACTGQSLSASPTARSAPPISLAAASGEAAMLAAVCSGCHGAGGQAAVELRGYSAQTLALRMRAYQSQPGTTVMHRLARGYSADQIDLIAQFLGRRDAHAD